MSDHDTMQLIAQLKHDDNKVRIAAIKALSHFKTSHEVRAALSKLLDDMSPIVVRSAILALGQVGDCNIVDELTPLLNHDNLWIQKAVVQALGRLGCPEVVPILVNLLGTDDLDTLAREALVALKVDPDFF